MEITEYYKSDDQDIKTKISNLKFSVDPVFILLQTFLKKNFSTGGIKKTSENIRLSWRDFVHVEYTKKMFYIFLMFLLHP